MQTISIADPLATSLANSSGLVEVRNSSGEIIGFFSPVTLEHAAQYAEAAAAANLQAIRHPQRSGTAISTVELLQQFPVPEPR